MNKEQMNKIVKAAQEKFDEAKNLILQEMQVALDEADRGNVSTDDAIDKIIDNFITTATAQLTINDEDGDSEDDEISWINEDAIDFDKDYNEIGILIQKDEDGGRKVAVEGSIQTRSYDAQDGSKRYVTEVIADNVEFLDSRQEGAQTGAQPPRQTQGEFTEVDDDELPF